jgi:branched-chain amino acid transport system substrate-binding protein
MIRNEIVCKKTGNFLAEGLIIIMLCIACGHTDGDADDDADKETDDICAIDDTDSVDTNLDTGVDTDSDTEVDTDSLAPEPETQIIKIGAIFPLSGSWASIGQSAQAALNMALVTVNSYLIKVYDSGGSAETADEALRDLDGQGIKAVIGPMTSEEAVTMMEYADNHDMLLISPSSTASSLAKQDNLFRLVPNDLNQARALAMLMKQDELLRVLPIYLDDVYGRDLAEGFRAQAESSDIAVEVLDEVSYAQTTTDFAPVAQAAADALAKVDADGTAVLLIGRDADAVSLFNAAGLGSPLADVKWYASDGIIRQPALLKDENAAAFAVSVALEGFGFACEETIPVVPLMMAAAVMSAELGGAPSPSSLPVWDALWFLAEAYRVDSNADITALKSNFVSVVNNGANVFAQLTSLDDNGDLAAAKYARFQVREETSGQAVWNIEGMFINNLTSGAFITDATSHFTRETGVAVLGAVLPISGADAENGQSALNAIYLALQHANLYYGSAEGLDIGFTVDVRDTRSDAATALAQVRALHEQGINLIIGPLDSDGLAAVESYANDNGVILLSTTSTAPSLAKPDRIMRLSPDDNYQAKALSRLVTAQKKDNAIIIYRDDEYGAGFAQAFEAVFEGTSSSVDYAADETDFTETLATVEDKISTTESTADVAVLLVGIGETISLLEQVTGDVLTSVSWYGADAVCKSRELLVSAEAADVAEKIMFTCSTYDIAGLRYFMPMVNVADAYLTPLVGGPSTWNEISAYDALWIGASAYAMTSPTADPDAIWTEINNPYGSIGIGGAYVFDDNGDQTLSSYAFYTVVKTDDGPAWKTTALYRDVLGAKDDLYILEE